MDVQAISDCRAFERPLLSSPLHLFFHRFFIFSFASGSTTDKAKRLSAWGLGMGICFIVTNDRHRETTRPTYGVWASWLPSYERPERSA